MAADLDDRVTLHGGHYCVRSLCPTMLLLTRKVQTTNAWAICLGGLAKKKEKKNYYYRFIIFSLLYIK